MEKIRIRKNRFTFLRVFKNRLESGAAVDEIVAFAGLLITGVLLFVLNQIETL